MTRDNPTEPETGEAPADTTSDGQQLENELSDVLDAVSQENRRVVTGQGGEREGREHRGTEMDIQLIREVMYALHEVSIGTHQLLYFSAMRYCKNYIPVDVDNVDDAIQQLQRIFDRLNVGELTVQEQDSDKIMLALHDNAFTLNDVETDKPICYFLAGYIAGLLEQALGDHYVVNEVQCTAQGHDKCVFQAQRR